MDRRIKFRHLDAFSAIARAGSMKGAAAELNLTQPALTKTMNELEEIVGRRLAERSRTGVRLTPEGAIFLQFAEQSTAALRHGLRSLEAPGQGAGRLAIGALPSVASGLVPRAVQAFCGQYPDVQISVQEGPHHDLTARLRAGRLDLVVGRPGRPESMAGLGFRQLYTEEVVVVARPDSPARDVTRFADLEAFRVVYPPRDAAIRPLVARMLIAQGVPLYGRRIESASTAFGRAVLAADPLAVWFISRGVVAGDLAEGRLVRLPLDTAPTAGPVGVMTSTDEPPALPARRFATLLAEIAAAAG